MSKKTNLSFLAVTILAGFVLANSAWAVDPNLVAHWKLDEGSETVVNDSAGTNNGTVYGAAWTDGKISGAMSFDGVNDYIEGTSSPFDFANTTFTVSAWFKTTAPHGMIVTEGGNYGGWMLRTVDTGLLMVQLKASNSSDAYDAKTMTNYNNDTWYQVAAVITTNTSNRAGNHADIYVDGLLVPTSEVKPLSYAPATPNWRIGARYYSPLPVCFNGKIDDVRIYNRALSAQEIRELYLEAFSPTERAIAEIQDAIDEKLEAVEKMDAALERENKALDAVNELLKGGDYGDLTKNDVLRAKQEIQVAIVQQQTSKRTLETTIERLENALTFLGYEPPPEPPTPDPNLVAHWKLDEGAGTVANDSVGTNNGTVYGAIWTTGQLNGALSFDGSNDYVNVGDLDAIVGSSPFTIAVWVNPNSVSGSNKEILAKAFGQNSYQTQTLIRLTSAGKFEGMFSNGSVIGNAIMSASTIPLSTWSFLVFSWDGTTNPAGMKLYVNGTLDATRQSTCSSIQNLNYPAFIGAYSDAGLPLNYFNGKIDDVRIYNRALSAQEIQELYQGLL